MSLDSSSGGVASALDLSTQAGIMAVLAAVRVSTLDSAHKSELRDLVLQYTNGGRDESTRRLLEQKIVAYGVTVVALPTHSTPVVRETEFGSIRPAPQFAPVILKAPTPITTPQASSAPVQPITPVVPAAPTQAPTPVAPIVSPVVPVSTPAPVASEPIVAPPVVAPVIVPEVPIPASAPVVEMPMQDAVGDTSVQLNRIREIKSIVNEKVGNPVNLVDINNAVGREYMAALLDAMKKINAGSAGVAAMERLEQSFQAVQTVLATHAERPATTEEVAQTESVKPTAVSNEPLQSVPPIDSPVSKPPITVLPNPVQFEGGDHHISPISISPVTTSSIDTSVNQVLQPQSSAPVSYVPQSAIPAIPSLADQKVKLRSPNELPDPASLANASVTGDPLMTKLVDDGLEQLLLEWSLFKKSGLFGTGPKGREHPLFKKVASLPIPLLLAGRFEGATQEIKQSITDYMNGWRYEQGIVYEQGETFEHYLRRVIKHIIDLQNLREAK